MSWIAVGQPWYVGNFTFVYHVSLRCPLHDLFRFHYCLHRLFCTICGHRRPPQQVISVNMSWWSFCIFSTAHFWSDRLRWIVNAMIGQMCLQGVQLATYVQILLLPTPILLERHRFPNKRQTCTSTSVLLSIFSSSVGMLLPKQSLHPEWHFSVMYTVKSPVFN